MEASTMLLLSHDKPTAEEVTILIGWLNDPNLMRFSEQRHKAHTVKSQLAYVNSFTGPDLYLKILCNGILVGTISARVDAVNGVADAGVLIGRSHEGHGHGCEAWRQFGIALAQRGVRKIEGGCMGKNTAMIRIFEKNHMRLEGTKRYHFHIGADYDHLIMYGKLT